MTGQCLLDGEGAGLIDAQWLDHWGAHKIVRQFHMAAPLRCAGDHVGRDAIAAALRTVERVVEGASIDMLHLGASGQRCAFRIGLLSQSRQVRSSGVVAFGLSPKMASTIVAMAADVDTVDRASTRVRRLHILLAYRTNRTMALSERSSASLLSTSSSEAHVRLPKIQIPVQSRMRPPTISVACLQLVLGERERSQSFSVDSRSALSLLVQAKHFSCASVTSRLQSAHRR